MPFPADAVGEVIEASTTEVVAQCCRLHEPPAFGALVKVAGAAPVDADPFAGPKFEEGAVFALVHSVRTTSLDPGRRPSAFGLSEDELRRQQPQVFELLATEFSALVVAHVTDGALRVGLPPRPPRVHAPLEACTTEETLALTATVDCAAAVLRSAACTVPEDLVAAHLLSGAVVRPDGRQYLVDAARRVALLIADDYPRIDAIVRKLGL